MSKRSVTEVQSTSTHGQPYAKVSVGGAKRENAAPEDIGEFEDAWEDEVDDSEEEVVDSHAKNDDGT
jgi:ribosome assembly protein RRB1